MHVNVNIKHIKIDTSVFQCLERKDGGKRYGKNHMEPKVVDKETGKEDHTLSLKRSFQKTEVVRKHALSMHRKYPTKS